MMSLELAIEIGWRIQTSECLILGVKRHLPVHNNGCEATKEYEFFWILSANRFGRDHERATGFLPIFSTFFQLKISFYLCRTQINMAATFSCKHVGLFPLICQSRRATTWSTFK